MTDAKIRDVLDRYETHLSAYGGNAWVDHLLTMIPKMREMLANNSATLPDIADVIANTAMTFSEGQALILHYTHQREKVMRWLGFLQGALWVKGIYTIDELRAHNMPDGETMRDA
jgi:methionine salvage enolase-phosphatase E1